MQYYAYPAVRQYLNGARLSMPAGDWIKMQAKTMVKKFVRERRTGSYTYLIAVPAGQAVKTEVCAMPGGYRVLMTEIVKT